MFTLPPAGIKKQACYARKCVQVKTDPLAASPKKRSNKPAAGFPSMFAEPVGGFADFDEVRSPSSPRPIHFAFSSHHPPHAISTHGHPNPTPR